MSEIHKTAIISPKAEIGENVTIGPFTVIEDSVIVGDNCDIKSSILLAEGTVLGKNVNVFHGAAIGSSPQDLKFGGEKTQAIVGDGTTIREYVTFNRGTTYHNRSECGKNCLLMAYSHVAHDCLIGDNVIMANSVNLAGHVEVHDNAILGGLVPVHQFVKIGAHCMIGGGFRVQQDIIPYALVGGYPLKVVGMNSIGLKRRGFTKDAVRSIDRAFKILFFSKLNTTQAVERITIDTEIIPEVQVILDFIKNSERGIVK
ncbi:MAG TPA: acyl-ACP--UDP-N-acetylglucosamine O-acyltransferase [candidate division Zixibacteria bacterium]|nr:acyl-ACP--UDP-N-acetylglucosamine O-acyltransferase [candidate division Zixibacteria bacterium]